MNSSDLPHPEDPYTPPTAALGVPIARLTNVGPPAWREGLIMGGGFGLIIVLVWLLVLLMVHAMLMYRDTGSAQRWFGILLGVSSGMLIGLTTPFQVRPAILIVPASDEASFLDNLDLAMARIHHKRLDPAGAARRYAPKTAIRREPLTITVRLGQGRATIAGPKENLKLLRKQIGRHS